MTHRLLAGAFLSGVCALGVGATPTRAMAQELLPNLRALPAANLQVAADAETGNPELRFSTTSWNSGAGPLELVPGQAGQAGQDVYQRVYRKDGTFADHLAGTFVFHPDHSHFHFQEYALYTLRPVNAPGASQRQSYKTSFCVMDTSKMNTRLPGAPKQPVYYACNLATQGMSVGWGDTYGAHLAGQEIDLTGNPDGLYELTVTIDPAGRLRETNEGDNVACSLVQISVTAGTVQPAGACGATGSTVSVTSIAPSSGVVGSTFDVVISGANFTSGVAVGFENGSGATPTVSGVTVLNSSTISATVTIKNSGRNSSDPVWDLRVGSAVLANAFTVVR